LEFCHGLATTTAAYNILDIPRSEILSAQTQGHRDDNATGDNENYVLVACLLYLTNYPLHLPIIDYETGDVQLLVKGTGA